MFIVKPKIAYTVCQKTSQLWLAITLTRMNGFWCFWQKCYRWTRQWKDALLCHLK